MSLYQRLHVHFTPKSLINEISPKRLPRLSRHYLALSITSASFFVPFRSEKRLHGLHILVDTKQVVLELRSIIFRSFLLMSVRRSVLQIVFGYMFPDAVDNFKSQGSAE